MFVSISFAFLSFSLLVLTVSLAPAVLLSWWVMWEILKDAPDRIRRGGGPKG